MSENMQQIKEALGEIDRRLVKRVDQFDKRLGEAEERLSGLEKIGASDCGGQRLRQDMDVLSEQVRRRDQSAIGGLTRALGCAHECRPRVFEDDAKAAGFGKFAFDLIRRRDMSAESDAAGGYLVPVEYIPDLVRAVERQGVLRREARIVPIAGKQSHWPKRVGGVTTYWVTPGTTITASDMIFGQVTLTATKLAALVLADAELEEESEVALGQILASEFAYAFAAEEDRVGFKGRGEPTDGNVTGVLNHDDVNVVTMASTKTGFDDLSYDNLVDMEAAVVSPALAGARWYMHRSVLAVVKKLKDSAQNPLWQPPSGSEPATLLGYPIRVVDRLPALSDSAVSTKFIVFGDMRMGVYLGDRKRMTLAQSEHVRFEADQVAYRAIEEIAITVAEGSALAVLETAAS